MALPLTVPKNGHANMPGNRYVTTPCVSSPEDNETHKHTHSVLGGRGWGGELTLQISTCPTQVSVTETKHENQDI